MKDLQWCYDAIMILLKANREHLRKKCHVFVDWLVEQGCVSLKMNAFLVQQYSSSNINNLERT